MGSSGLWFTFQIWGKGWMYEEHNMLPISASSCALLRIFEFFLVRRDLSRKIRAYLIAEQCSVTVVVKKIVGK